MAQTKADIEAARAELAELNEQLGFRRNKAPEPTPIAEPMGAPENDAGDSAPAGPPATDPGPPRFIGIDLDQRLAGLAGGAAIPISENAVGAIVDVLLGELREHLDRTLALVRATHVRKSDPAQVDIEFPDGPRDPA